MVCLFILLMIVFDEQNFLFEVQYINIFSFMIHLLLCPKKSLPNSQSLRFFLSFLLEVLWFLAVGFGPLIHFKLMFMVCGKDRSLLFFPYKNTVMLAALIKKTIPSTLNYLVPFSINISYIKSNMSLFLALNFCSLDLCVNSYSKTTLTWL